MGGIGVSFAQKYSSRPFLRFAIPFKFFLMAALLNIPAKNDSLLYPSAQVYDWGTTLVIAPHPTFEFLGCGGAMILLRQMGYRVRILFVGDGREYADDSATAEDLTGITASNKSDISDLIQRVGISPEAATYFDLRANLLPQRSEPGFEEAVRMCLNQLEYFQPETVLLPFLNQSHRDTLATWQIVREASRMSKYPLRMVEYRLWSGTSQEEIDTSVPVHYKHWRLDIKDVIDLKLSALDSHWQPQPVLPWQNMNEGVLTHLSNPWEVYLEYDSRDTHKFGR